MNIVLVLHKYGVPLSDPCIYPLGFMYVSATLKQQGHKVKVLNYNLWDYDLKEEIKNQDVVMFTGFEEFKNSIIRDSQTCKEAGVQVIIGGALATFCTEEMSKYSDLICIGEFEQCSINEIPFPDYEGFEVEEYFKRNEMKHIGVLTSRGCPFHCTFCSQTCGFRMRDLSNVFQEIDEYINKYKPDSIIFNDNTFNINKQRFIKVCEEMRSRKIAWGASIRCDVFDESMVVIAKNSGCLYFVVGIESFTQERLDMMNKCIKVEDIYRTLDLLHKHKINYHGNILLGFENDTYQDIANEVSKIPVGYSVFPILVQPFIGTQNGRQRLLTSEESKFLSEEFRNYVYANDKYQYPSLIIQ